MRKNPTYMALLGPTRLLISEKSATYMIKWSYTIIWQVRVPNLNKVSKIKFRHLRLQKIFGFLVIKC